jgi:hypothetical protein
MQYRSQKDFRSDKAKAVRRTSAYKEYLRRLAAYKAARKS